MQPAGIIRSEGATTASQHRLHSWQPTRVTPPDIDADADLLRSFSSDAAHVPGGNAAGVAFPRNLGETAALVTAASQLLPVGAQSSLTGGATPRGEIVLSTRALTTIDAPRDGQVRVGAGVPLQMLQHALAAHGFYYPPVPTFDGAFVGGTIATNAAGAATFKYGTTRDWVIGLTVVLASGEVVSLHRGEVTASVATASSPYGRFELEDSVGRLIEIDVPRYQMPRVPKLSAGYFAQPEMDAVDLFIGSEGTLGVIVDATLRVISRPRLALAMIRCTSEDQALALTASLRSHAALAWRGAGALDVSAVEYIDSRSLAVLQPDAFNRAHMPRPGPDTSLLLVQIEPGSDDGAALAELSTVLDTCGVDDDPVVALPESTDAASRLFELRESVPASVNARIRDAQRRHPSIQKTAADLIVPFDRLKDALAVYRRTFEARGLEYAIWGHMSDGNLHPNVMPSNPAEMQAGLEAIHEMAAAVMTMGGAPLAEHGVGRSGLKQQLLREMYGEDGIEQMRAVKRALDPEWKLSPGVLFPRRAGE